MLTRSYAVLETLKMRIRMKPAPKPVDVATYQKPKRVASLASFAED